MNEMSEYGMNGGSIFMSKKVTEESEKKDEKIVTRYDRKVQKR